MDHRLGDVEFVARSEHRVGVLETLAEGPRDRADLREATGASKPTIGRVLSDLECRQWIAREGGRYELTPLGVFVAGLFAELLAGMATERKLRDVWRWLPREMAEFSVDLFADAVVSYPGPGYPYQPVERVNRLLESTERIRGVGTTIYKSGNLETFCRRVLDGMEAEYVYAPSVLRAIVAWNPELVAEAFACENCTVYLHDALPDDDRCGLNVMDDCIGICGHDPDTAQLEAVIDTRSPEARAWATAVYERAREEARPFDPAEFALGGRNERLRVEAE